MTALFVLLAWLLQATAKGSLVILLIAAGERLIGGRLRARWRYALWLLVLVRLLLPVAPSSGGSVFNLIPIHPAIELQLRGAAAQLTFFDWPAVRVPWWIAHWQLLAAVWLLGVSLVVARAAVAALRIRAAVARGTACERAAAIVEQCRRQLGIARAVRAVESHAIETPALHGVFRPALVLPAGLCNALAPGELRHVVLHELSHLRRHDAALSWLSTAVAALHWFNPLVHFAVARIAEERELACDELTLASLDDGERLRYGRTILKLVEHFRAPAAVPALVGIVSEKEKMRRRLTVIASGKPRTRLAPPLAAAAGVLVVFVLADARGGRADALTLDPPSIRALDRIDRPVTLDLTNATLPELLDAVSAKSGLAIAQSPAIAAFPVQQARFTVHAANVAPRALLMRELLPFGVVAAPSANGVTLARAPDCLVHRARDAPRSP